MPNTRKVGYDSTGQGIIVDALVDHSKELAEGERQTELLKINDPDTFYAKALRGLPPSQNLKPVKDEQQTLYYGAELGQIKTRTAAGEWFNIDTGRFEPVTQVQVHGQSIFAALDNRELYYLQDRQSEWRSVLSFDYKIEISQILIGKDQVFVLALDHGTNKNTGSTEPRKVVIYRSALDSTLAFEPIEVDFVTTEPMFPHLPKTHGVVIDEKLYVGITGQPLRYLDLNSQKWHQVSNYDEYHKAKFGEDGFIMLYRAQGIFSKILLSADNGKNWKEISDTKDYLVNPFFQSMEEGYAISADPGAFEVEINLEQYNANGDFWTRVETFPRYCKYVIEGIKFGQLFCVSKSGDVFNKVNNQWVNETATSH